MYKRFMLSSLAILAFSNNAFAHGSCDDTQLHHDMHQIKDELRVMSSQVKSGDNKGASQTVEKVITLFKESRQQTPYLFKQDKLKGAELTKKEKAFHGVIDDTIDVFESLETALKANDMKKVKSLMGQIGQQRKIGHSSFKASC